MRASSGWRAVVGLVLASIVVSKGARGEDSGAACACDEEALVQQPPTATLPIPDDDRPDFDATFFIGSAIDNFAADDVSSYLNPDESGTPGVFERAIGGVQFAYRLWGSGDGGAEEPVGSQQLWAYGLTVHGVRSSDVDCKADPDIKVCKGFEEEVDPSGRFLYIVRNASSLEGAVGFRWEFMQLRAGGESPARMYAVAQAGFVSVAGIGEDVVDQHHVGVGAVASAGRFRESFIELGYGKSDLFVVNPDSRFKINAFLSWVPARFEDRATTAFARILIDSDFGDGADSIQSYFGLRFDLAKLFDKNETEKGDKSTKKGEETDTDSESPNDTEGGDGAARSPASTRTDLALGR